MRMRLIAIHCLLSKNQWMPKRSISPDAFDAILSELGDDPTIIRPKRQESATTQNHSAMNRHPYDTDAMRLPNQFPHADSHPNTDPLGAASNAYLHRFTDTLSLHERRIWLGLALCLTISTALNTYLIYEWRADADLKTHTLLQTDPDIPELKAILLQLQSDIADDHDALLDLMENTAQHNKSKAQSTALTQHPLQSKHSLAELSLKRWRYLGMSESESGITGFFDTDSGMQTLALHSTVMNDWKLSSITREAAGLSSLSGKSVLLHVSKGQ